MPTTTPSTLPAAQDPARPMPATARPWSRAWQIALAYAVFATLWIFLSDGVLGALIRDPAQLVEWSVYKGIVFVVVTSLLLLWLVARAFGTIEAGYAALRERENDVQRVNRLYVALSQINQAIVRSRSRDVLFQAVCRILVEHGGFRMAWVGWHDETTGALVPMAAWGEGRERVHDLVIHTDEGPQGRGPAGTAFRSGHPSICNDVRHDPAMQPWRADALRWGLHACAALPVRQKGDVRAVLLVYAGEPDYFRGREMSLLENAALDLSFALDNLALEADHLASEALAAQERYFSQTMLESMPGILYFYNEQGKLLRWNRNFETVSGYTGAEIARMHPLEFFASADQRPLAQRIAEVFATGEATIEVPFLSRDGTATPYFFTGRLVMFDGARCLVGVGIDISERKRAEKALRELNETLEQRVDERTAALQNAVERAEAADRLKSAFLATMSHELRTPLNSIIGFTGIILQGLAGPLNPEQTKQLGMVRGSARHLLELINDVLDLSKIEAGQLEVRAEPFSLEASIERVMASVKPLADKKALTLEAVTAAPVGEMVSDRRRVEQVLINLLNNAIKFTDRGGVTLHVEPMPSRPDRPDAPLLSPSVRLRVTDTGIGMRTEDLASLFQPFRQLDNGLTRLHEGTGLGLVICRRLVHLMGGRISAASQPGAGSEFTVILPLEPLPPS